MDPLEAASREARHRGDVVAVTPRGDANPPASPIRTVSTPTALKAAPVTDPAPEPRGDRRP